eukprot:CAMPEP_0170551882 /NCGR_PEP_ID=MMETSP0211-20121228/9877_1 /TAXON_ID=311385 /ORGANISM="Pseudokeronopsis sp., Strain OXSARD2" /LENGTH=122 /DNA_ID=CAMNT_0010859327 /DNA_START=750 /DNA_END=1118 /DNA_ORIENTATION=+
MDLNKLDITLEVQSKEEKKERNTYSLNPNINKRMKHSRLFDIRKQAVKNIKSNLNAFDEGFFGQTGHSKKNYYLKNETVRPPKEIAFEKESQDYKRKSCGVSSSIGKQRREKKLSLDNSKFH